MMHSSLELGELNKGSRGQARTGNRGKVHGQPRDSVLEHVFILSDKNKPEELLIKKQIKMLHSNV